MLCAQTHRRIVTRVLGREKCIIKMQHNRLGDRAPVGDSNITGGMLVENFEIDP